MSRFERMLVILGVIVVAAGLAFQGGRAAAPAAHPIHLESDDELVSDLERRYGPGHHSEDLEEWIIRDVFRDRRGGVFVDVGANDYEQLSNTYYLETALGWSGVAVEPQKRFAAGYARFRPRTVFVPLFVSDVSNRTATLYVPKHADTVASSDRQFAESFEKDVTPTPTTTSTLDDILDRLDIRKIDFLSMDIELAEPEALAGFSIERFAPELVCIEAHRGVRERILEYFRVHGYVLIGKYWRIDGDNFWFSRPGTVKDDEKDVRHGPS
jgi:FkbM family methyltransferase